MTRTAVFFALLALVGRSTPLPVPNEHISLLSAPGEDMLLDPRTIREPYFKLSAHLTTQHFESYCGVATSVTVLNGFGGAIKAPVDPQLAPFPYFTQENVFQSDCAMNVTTPGWIEGGGMDLAQVARLIGCWGPKTKAIQIDEDMTLDEFRRILVNVLLRADAFVTVNFDRRVLNEEGFGHHSPVGAYNPTMDRFLLMDVARFKYPPHWVTAKLLFQAVNTGDGLDRRGFVVATTKQGGDIWENGEGFPGV